jgi:hypothetical protein
LATNGQSCGGAIGLIGGAAGVALARVIRIGIPVVDDAATSIARSSSGAESAISGNRLRAQLVGEEIAGGHAFEKHVVQLAEFPGTTTRRACADIIENVTLNGEPRTLSGGRTAFWKDDVVVIRDPKNIDGGTAFKPSAGYKYFLNQIR